MIESEAAPAAWDRRAGWLVVAVTLLVFAPVLVFQRVALDDEWLWSDASPLRSPSLATWHHVWLELDARTRRDVGTEYLPVRDMAVAGDMAVWGDHERGPHATQLALYAATVFALGGLLVRFGVRRDLAWLATLLWAIHPLHVEAVAWLSERKGVLAGLFVVLCGHAWVRYRRGGSAGWLVAAALAAVAGTWSKAPAMFAPAVFAAWDVLVLPAARRRWIAIGAIGVATALAAVPVVQIARDGGVVDNQFEAAPDDSRLVRALGAQGHYLESLVLARAPSVSYPIQTEGAGPLELALGGAAVLGSLVLVGLGGLGGRRRRTGAWPCAWLAWAWIWFFPVSHLATAVHIGVADRYAYLWSLAGCAGAAWLVLRSRGPARLAIVGAVICALGIATLRAEAAWTSSRALFANALAASPRDPVACERLVNELLLQGEPRAALAVVDRGLAFHPDHGYLLSRKAHMLDDLGQPVEALAVAEHAARGGHASAMAYYAELLARAGRTSEALGFAERATARRPEQASYARLRDELRLGPIKPAAPPTAASTAICCTRAVAQMECVMKRVLLGMLMFGWVGCAMDEMPPSTPPIEPPATEAVTSQPETVAVPQFNRCLAGWSCVAEESCGGPLSGRAPCGVGLFCCPPVNPQ